VKLKCDAGCKKEFILNNQYTYYTEKVEDLTELFYKCPKCGFPYHVVFENDKTLDLYKQIVAERNNLSTLREIWEINKSNEKIKKLVTQRKILLNGVQKYAGSKNIKNITERNIKISDKKPD